jgi:hypothetical protein
MAIAVAVAGRLVAHLTTELGSVGQARCDQVEQRDSSVSDRTPAHRAAPG